MDELEGVLPVVSNCCDGGQLVGRGEPEGMRDLSSVSSGEETGLRERATDPITFGSQSGSSSMAETRPSPTSTDVQATPAGLPNLRGTSNLLSTT